MSNYVLKSDSLDKAFMISRLVIALLVFIVFNMTFSRESSSSEILPFVFSAIAFGFSFPSSIISNKLLNTGQDIESIIVKILFYVLFVPILSAVCCVIAFLICVSLFSSMGMAGAVWGMLAIMTTCTIILLPAIQTILVLIIRHFIEE